MNLLINPINLLIKFTEFFDLFIYFKPKIRLMTAADKYRLFAKSDRNRLFAGYNINRLVR